MMELTAVGAVAAKVAPKLGLFLLEKHKLRTELKHDIILIKNECSMIAAAIEDDGKLHHSSDAASAHEQWIEIVRELAYDIDDCIDRYEQLLSTAPVTDAWWIRRKVNQLKTLRARDKFAATIIRLRKQSYRAAVLRKRYTDLAYGQGGRVTALQSQAQEAKTAAEAEAKADATLCAAGLSVDAVGMEAAHDVKLIMETPHGQQPREKLKVISIVGFGGIGKTLLANHVYHSAAVVEQYTARVWVHAGTKGPEDVLKDILRQLGMQSTLTTINGGCEGTFNADLCTTIKKCLENVRFLIIIDDMRVDFWVLIKDAFPAIPGVNSRVIITTASQTIAMKSSSRDGHVYIMRTLTVDHSKELFFRKACMEYPPTARDMELSSEVIKKCDGLPLALVTTALSLHGETRSEQWADVGENLGRHLEKHGETDGLLARMQRVLVRSYTSLSEQDIKTCLLYLGIYPSGHPIRRGSMIRRWSAEGFIRAAHNRTALKVAVDNFNELVDRSILQRIDASDSSSAEVKTCQTHGIMLQFILHKCMRQNFVTLLYDNVPLPSKVRWFSLHNGSAACSKIDPKHLQHVRSLTIFGKAHTSALDFSKYKLLRVLDLEECGNILKDKHLEEICSNLLLLRYLSLRGTATITVLPRDIKKLLFLETLDLKGTKIDIVPKDVLRLPSLIHLFGRFKLEEGTRDKENGKLETWLSENNSKLETVAEFVVDSKSLGWAELMHHMKHLRKVKICCQSTADTSSNLSHVSKAEINQRGSGSVGNLSKLSEAIKGFIERSGTDKNRARSISLNINDVRCQELLNFTLINASSCHLSSLKLQGNKISSLPPFATTLCGVNKLCLSFIRLQLSSDMIEALNSVSGLEYLKLVATRLDKLVIRRNGLKGLQHLCVVAEVWTELEIQEGAMPDLESLRLFCKDVNGLNGKTILSLPRLNEVALHDKVSEEKKKQLIEAANYHPRRPKLLFLTKERVDDLFKPMRSDAPAGTATDMMLSVTTPSDAISAGQAVPVVTSDAVPEPAIQISSVAPATTTDNTTMPVKHDAVTDAQREYPVVSSETASEPHATANNIMLPVKHDNITAAQQEDPDVTSETQSDPAVEIMPLALTADKMMLSANHDTVTNAHLERPVIQAVILETRCEPAVENSPPAPVTTSNTKMPVNHDAVTDVQQEHLAPAVIPETETKPAAQIPEALATIDTMISVKHNAVANAPQGHPVPVLTSDTGSETMAELYEAPATIPLI